jgi:hypothetical protein
MPLTPAIRPVNAIRRTAERPISAPPTADAIGVKDVVIIAASMPSGRTDPDYRDQLSDASGQAE